MLWRLFSWSALLLAGLPLATAQMSPAAVAALSELPKCSLNCLIVIGTASPCGVANTTCLCTNEQVQLQITQCVTANCTIKEALTAKNVTSGLCGVPVYDESNFANTLSIVMGSLCVAFWVVRIAVKIFISKMDFGPDDLFISISALGSIPSSVIQVMIGHSGLGKDIWTVPFDQITNFGRYFYALAILYFAHLAILKLSLLFFYLRVFPNKGVRKVLWGTIVFVAIFGIVFCLIAIFQCQPIDYFWTKWDGEHTGTCLSINSITWSNAAINIALDLWVLSIPMSQLSGLQLHWKKKIGVGLMFVIGTFVTVVSVIRLQFLVRFGDSQNPTHDQTDVTSWSDVEVSVGIMCLCMPQIRLVLVRYFPTVFGLTRTGTYGNSARSKTFGSTGGISSHGRSARLKSSQNDEIELGNKNSILYQQTFAVEYETHDQSRLVDKKPLGFDDPLQSHIIEKDKTFRAPSSASESSMI